jgi:hypothetical protein
MRRLGSWFRLREVEPSFKEFDTSRMDACSSFKEFIHSSAIMCLGLMSIKPDVGYKKSFPACFFRVMPV